MSAEGRLRCRGGPANGPHIGLLQQLDDFENKWFPRTRRIIERFTPDGHRVGLLDAFFRDLQQQPIGPLVVGSVSTFLDRVEALEKSDVPGAAKVRAVLADRGVDAAYEAVWLWWRDWRETFHSEVDGRLRREHRAGGHVPQQRDRGR